jgi:hypothetical protein
MKTVSERRQATDLQVGAGLVHVHACLTAAGVDVGDIAAVMANIDAEPNRRKAARQTLNFWLELLAEIEAGAVVVSPNGKVALAPKPHLTVVSAPEALPP